MTKLPWLMAIAALFCALAGCGGYAERSRICRSIIPALNPPQTAIEIKRTVALGNDEVRIDYRTRPPIGAATSRWLECRFAPAAQASRQRDQLVGVATEAGALGELRLYVLRRFWLEREGATADPEPIAAAARAPEVPRAIAVSLQHLLFALPSIAVYALLAAAYSLIYGLVGRINLAFGELAAVGGYAAFLAFALIGTSGNIAIGLGLALVLALATALSHGVAAGRLVLRPLLLRRGQQVLIGTIGLAIVLQEYLRLAQGSRLLWLQPMFNAPYAVARAGDFVVTVTPVALTTAASCLIAALALVGVMRLSRFGRAWRACADDPLAAALFGIDRDLVFLQTFSLASALAGLAGCVLTIYYGSVGYAGGIVLGLKSLVAAIAGGIGSVPGALLGGVLLGGAESIWSALFPIEFRDLAIFVLLVLLLVLRPTGLLGSREPAPYASGVREA
jgi:branched-chain amino acid transport system permease protein